MRRRLKDDAIFGSKCAREIRFIASEFASIQPGLDGYGRGKAIAACTKELWLTDGS